jgi:2-C-methyl-D-erythritol 4-phosphate cytidylyltransferase / 2-C-methyl-D-erythritol 2,4-cyclodiphosphate synthase
VVIPAAGRARRFGSTENKIWVKLSGRTVLERTLAAFQAHTVVTAIVVAAGADEMERVKEAAKGFSKVADVVAGGSSRTESVRCGLNALPTDVDLVLVHDAARPLVSAEVISNVIAAAAKYGASVPGTPVADTVKRADLEGIVRATVPRVAEAGNAPETTLVAVQTPQGALRSVLEEAYAALDARGAEGPEPTDEASLIEANGGTVAIAAGDSANIKVTRPEDVALAERLLGETEVRTGFGYDVHAFASPEAGRTLYLGGIAIPHDRGLEGHSDADVILHAVCDALLGAASLGDIGILFPNTDNAFKNISSLKLLAVVRDRLAELGWQVVNIDATAVAEAPKLMPHRDAMQQAMAAELGIDAERISVKATTSEKMGFVGRKEGIACWAVATIRR